MKVDGLRPLTIEQLTAGPGMPAAKVKPGTRVQWTPPKPKPEDFEGLHLVKETQALPHNTIFPERLTIRLPIWDKAKASPVGWAVFENVKPVVTGDTTRLMWPMNIDIFDPAFVNRDLHPHPKPREESP
jgi:hypothetical protein